MYELLAISIGCFMAANVFSQPDEVLRFLPPLWSKLKKLEVLIFDLVWKVILLGCGKCSSFWVTLAVSHFYYHNTIDISLIFAFLNSFIAWNLEIAYRRMGQI